MKRIIENVIINLFVIKFIYFVFWSLIWKFYIVCKKKKIEVVLECLVEIFFDKSNGVIECVIFLLMSLVNFEGEELLLFDVV